MGREGSRTQRGLLGSGRGMSCQSVKTRNVDPVLTSMQSIMLSRNIKTNKCLLSEVDRVLAKNRIRVLGPQTKRDFKDFIK